MTVLSQAGNEAKRKGSTKESATILAVFTNSLRTLARSSRQRRPLSKTIGFGVSRRILIIDDDRELCDLVGELLGGERFEVQSDGIFADSLNSELASITGNPSSCYAATFTIGLAA
jgi:hypothetical protein